MNAAGILSVYLGIGILCWAVIFIRGRKSTSEAWLAGGCLLDPWLGVVALVTWPLWLGLYLFAKATERSETTAPREGPSVDLKGRVARVVLPLRPTGRVRIGNTYFEARSEGEVIAAGEEVVVTGNQIGELKVEKRVRK